MRKEISFDEPVPQFDEEGKRLEPKIVRYTLIANNQEEYDSHMSAITEEGRGITNIEVKDPEPSLEELEKELASTDYKITKSYEYFLVGLETPYDVNELHQQRQKIRDQINDLLSNLESE